MGTCIRLLLFVFCAFFSRHFNTAIVAIDSHLEAAKHRIKLFSRIVLLHYRNRQIVDFFYEHGVLLHFSLTTVGFSAWSRSLNAFIDAE